MKNKLDFGLKKKYTKFKSLGLRNIEVNNFYYKKLLGNIEMSPVKMRKWVYWRLSKYKMVKNVRPLFFTDMKNFMSVDPLKSIFFRYSYSVFVSQSYYKISDKQLELFRRTLRQKCGKHLFINLKIQNFYNVLKRPNQMRMGGGKGSKFDKKVFFLFPGFIFIEIRVVRIKRLNYAYKELVKKVPFDFKLIYLNKV